MDRNERKRWGLWGEIGLQVGCSVALVQLCFLCRHVGFRHCPQKEQHTKRTHCELWS